MSNQEILDNAPEGATHIDDEGAYFKRTKQGHTFWWVNQASWMPAESNRSTRSLVDIAKIAELEKLGNEMAIIIADLRTHLKIRGE